MKIGFFIRIFKWICGCCFVLVLLKFVFLFWFVPFWVDPDLSEDELFKHAEGVVRSDAEHLQELADDVFRNWKPPEYDGKLELPEFRSPLQHFARRLSHFGPCRNLGDLGYELHSDYHRHPKIIHWKFGPRRNSSWLVVYPSWDDVSDVEGVRWITPHIGVRDNGVIYYPDHVEIIPQITPKDY